MIEFISFTEYKSAEKKYSLILVLDTKQLMNSNHNTKLLFKQKTNIGI